MSSTRGLPPTGVSQAERILRLIFDTVSCSCKDDRDRIFALLSLLHFNEEQGLVADYNLSTMQVYTGIAAFLATNGLAWAVFMLASRLASNAYSVLPSWVPDWKKLGDAGFEDPAPLDHMITRSHNFQPDIVSAVTSSGAITIQGKILGHVTVSKYGPRYMAEERDRMHMNHRLFIGYMNSNWESYGVKQFLRDQTTWTFTKPAQSPFDDSWELHIEFGMCYQPPKNAQHLAIMLKDRLTVLILRHDDSLHDQCTLVDVGMPFVWGMIPRDRAWSNKEQCIEVPLRKLSISDLDNYRLHDVPFPPERFPRLRGYPHLWAYNPATLSMGLKHKAIEKLLSTDLTALECWLEWQKHAYICVQILSDERRLRLLIDEVLALDLENYKQIEVQAGLGPSWSLEHFLCLFIKDPLKTGPMGWPMSQINGDQPRAFEETAALPLLMRWAAVTYRFLVLLRPQINSGIPWLDPPPPQMKDAFPDAMAVARSHRLTASVVTNSHETWDSERVAFLLQKILHQLSESTEPLSEQERRVPPVSHLYWDWKKFESAVDEGLSALRHVHPDLQSLRSCFKTPTPDLAHADAHELLAAHGVDLKNEYTEIKIK